MTKSGFRKCCCSYHREPETRRWWLIHQCLMSGGSQNRFRTGRTTQPAGKQTNGSESTSESSTGRCRVIRQSHCQYRRPCQGQSQIRSGGRHGADRKHRNGCVTWQGIGGRGITGAEYQATSENDYQEVGKVRIITSG